MGKHESALASHELTRLPLVISVFALPEHFCGEGGGVGLDVVIVTE